jgi:hypothetical protein
LNHGGASAGIRRRSIAHSTITGWSVRNLSSSALRFGFARASSRAARAGRIDPAYRRSNCQKWPISMPKTASDLRRADRI